MPNDDPYATLVPEPQQTPIRAPAVASQPVTSWPHSTRADQNLNPGNIAWGGWAQSHGAYGGLGADTGHLVARFKTPQAGFDAMRDLAMNKYSSGRTSANRLVADAGGWTPGNRQAAANIARTMGLGPDDDLRLSDPAMMRKFQSALALQEGAPGLRGWLRQYDTGQAGSAPAAPSKLTNRIDTSVDPTQGSQKASDDPYAALVPGGKEASPQSAAPAGDDPYAALVPKQGVDAASAMQVPKLPPVPPPSPPEAPPQAASIGEASGAEAQAMQSAPGAGMVARAGEWLAKKYPGLQVADMLGDLTSWTEEKVQAAAEKVLPKRAAEDLTQYLFEFAPMQGGLGIKSPAIKTPEGSVVEGPNHPAIRIGGAEGEPGFTLGPESPRAAKAGQQAVADVVAGRFVDRTEGAKIAEAAGQKEPGTGPSLHSEDLRPGTSQADKMGPALAKVEKPQLRVAARMPDGSIRTGRPGQIHSDLLEDRDYARIDHEKDIGYVDPSGNYLTRKEAFEYTKKNEPARAEDTAGYGLDSARYQAVKAPAIRIGGAEGKPALAEAEPHSLGAAASAAVLDAYKEVPPTPTKDFINSTDDSGFRLRQSSTADMSQWREKISQMPEELKDANLQERIQRHIEGDDITLTLQEQDLYDKHVRPVLEENTDLYAELKKADPEVFDSLDPNYVHRMVKGKTPQIDEWMGDNASSDPVRGYKSTSAPSLKPRVYFAIESDTGTRRLVSITDKGTHILEKGKEGQKLTRYQGEASKPGDKFSADGEKWTVKQARTSEIEANTSTRYYNNAMASAVKNNVQLKQAARAVFEIRRLKETPEWQAYTSTKFKEGWRSVDFPLFRGTYFHPKFADVIDDIWGNRHLALGPTMVAVNRATTMSLFWSPVPHALNAGAHWATARGWDWVNPVRYATGAIDTARAVREVVTQGPIYQKFLREGGGLVYGSVVNEPFMRDMLKAFGEHVVREPSKWDPIARAMGVGPSDLVRMWYGASSRALWSTSDVFMLQRYLELQRKGLSEREAIAAAEKHIPNYRIPTEVMKSRALAVAMKDPSLFVFSRYHYGMWKSYAHMAKDLAGVAKNPKEAFNAMGNVFTTLFMASVLWPSINQAIQNLTGDKDIELGPKGSLTIPKGLWYVWQGKDIGQFIQSSITLSPPLNLADELRTNTDAFLKKPIVEQDDMEKGRYGRVGAQIGEKVAETAAPPYSAISSGMSKGGLPGAAAGLAKQGLGLRKPFKPYHGRTGGGTPAHNAAVRHAKPRGLIEAAEKKAEEWLRSDGGQ